MESCPAGCGLCYIYFRGSAVLLGTVPPFACAIHAVGPLLVVVSFSYACIRRLPKRWTPREFAPSVSLPSWTLWTRARTPATSSTIPICPFAADTSGVPLSARPDPSIPSRMYRVPWPHPTLCSFVLLGRLRLLLVFFCLTPPLFLSASHCRRYHSPCRCPAFATYKWLASYTPTTLPPFSCFLAPSR